MHPVYVDGIGVLGPGIESWQEAVCLLKGEHTYLPGKTILSPPESFPRQNDAAPAEGLWPHCRWDMRPAPWRMSCLRSRHRCLPLRGAMGISATPFVPRWPLATI
ncbi:hypothetical protein AFERRI_100143 [Acidithiobacillus ferrivorans]|uniref:Uncharacterized protein n=1 Tax=Acidithiobacillus ferrivorans TaxID=160808 RepID=A0A060UPG6_9PROT|nr:hypothetical protein AFERRI_100143 [Acidithiobacillus ferrivorans]